MLSAATVVAGATALVIGKELTVTAIGAPGARRAGTGSHEMASFDPAALPVVSWFDDRTPATATEMVTIAGRPVEPATIAAATSSLTATLDCTDGWRSTQDWDAVPLADVLYPADEVDGRRSGRSVRVTSATGYSRLFALGDLENIHLCTGYGGEPLRRGHGGPVRLVAPGRRGPWWVKWVVRVEVSDRPAWLQLPLPPT